MAESEKERAETALVAEAKQRAEAVAAGESERKQRELADQRYEEIIRLADLKRLADARAAAESLGGTDPGQIEEMKAWLSEQALPLQDRLPKHEAALGMLRERAMQEVVNEHRTWKFPDAQTQWQHDALAQLVEGLQAFVDPDPKIGTLADVQGRLAYVESIVEQSIAGAQAAAAWSEALADIAQLEVYGGLQLTPQAGLVPLRRDPRSGLWEFWHIPSGPKPELNTDEEAVNPWILPEDAGLIFVLRALGIFKQAA